MSDKRPPTEKQWRIHLLEEMINDSWRRITGSTSKYYLAQQARKRDEWQKKLDELKRSKEI